MSNWVDFAAIQGGIPLASLLQRYQVKLRRSGRDQYRGWCPMHRGEGREAFHANLSRNIFHCFSCGAGGSVLDFLAAIEGCTLRGAALRLQQEAFVPSERAAASRDGKQLVTKKRGTPTPLGFTLRGVDSTHPYLAARGMERRTAEPFGVGMYRGSGMFSGRLVIPIYNHLGELVAYGSRAVDDSEPRYRFPPGARVVGRSGGEAGLTGRCNRRAAPGGRVRIGEVIWRRSRLSAQVVRPAASEMW